MSTVELAHNPTAVDAAILENVVLGGDLSSLTPHQRLLYYRQVCSSLGLNPLTRPFSYIRFLSGGLKLYANRDCTDQLRKIHKVSISKPDLTDLGEFISVSVLATDKDGRTDSDIGVVMKTDMQKNIANVMKKAVTQAKRRVTLSICGLGMLDESEVPDVPGAKVVPVDAETGEVMDGGPAPEGPPTAPASDKELLIGRINTGMDQLKMKASERMAFIEKACGVARLEDAEVGDLQTMLGELVRRFKAEAQQGKK